MVYGNNVPCAGVDFITLWREVLIGVLICSIIHSVFDLSAKREGDEFFTEGGLVNENSNEGGFLFIMNLKI